MTTQKSKKACRGRTPTGQPNPIDVHVGNRIRLRRNVLGWSQEKMAKMLGLTFQQVQKYERGNNRVSASRLWDIGNVLNVPIGFFFEDMEKSVAQQSPRTFSSDDAQSGILMFREDNLEIDMDPMKRRETLELVNSYYRINNRKAAKLLLELAITMSKSNFSQKQKDDFEEE